MLLNFNDWDVYDGFAPGSGFSEKEWIIDNTRKTIGLFKFPKSDYTFEHFSEKIASELAKSIGIKSAHVDIGYYDDRVGSISYLVTDEYKEVLNEGIKLIYRIREHYNPDKLIDEKNNEYYSVYMILESIKQYGIENSIFDMIILDYLIGNSDRHHSNWAVISPSKTHKDKDYEMKVRMSPLYDNGSSLCCYINESVIVDKQNDDTWFKGIVNTKSKSIIRLDKYKKQKPTHLEMISYLQHNFYNETINRVKIISERLTDSYIRELIETYSYGMMSDERKKLLIKYLNHKIKVLVETYSK